MTMADEILRQRISGRSWLSIEIKGDAQVGSLNKRKAIAELKASSARRTSAMIAAIPATEESR